MHDQLGSTIIFASAALICLYYAVRCLMGKQTVRAAQPDPQPTPVTETPADAEWRRRLARWTAEDQDAS